MSFDIHFQPMRFSDTVAETGEPQTVVSTKPLDAPDLEAAQNVLNGATADGPDEDGCYVVELEDGGGAEVFGNELAEGCMVALRGITPDLVVFLFDLLKAGGGKWVMFPTIEDPVTITTLPTCLKGMPDFPRVVVCNSPDELGAVLTNGVRAWEKLRDRIVDDSE